MNDLKGHSPTLSLCRCDFLYSFVEFDKISPAILFLIDPSVIAELLVNDCESDNCCLYKLVL